MVDRGADGDRDRETERDEREARAHTPMHKCKRRTSNNDKKFARVGEGKVW